MSKQVIYSSRKTNKIGQRSIDCIFYNSSTIYETCLKDYIKSDKLCSCKVRFGLSCEFFNAGIGTRLYNGENDEQN